MKYLILILLFASCQKETYYAQISIRLKVMLQGDYNTQTGLMRKDLNRNSLLPIAQPYTAIYPGTEQINSQYSDSNLVDWLLVELMHNGEVRGRSAVLLLSDGNVSDINGRRLIPITLYALSEDSLYNVVVRHRNHLAVRTAYEVRDGAMVDFTKHSGYQNQSYTSQVYVETGWCMRAGDCSQDNRISRSGAGNDENYIRNVIGYKQYVYASGDLNMDGMINAVDVAFLNNNVLGGLLSVVYKEQL